MTEIIIRDETFSGVSGEYTMEINPGSITLQDLIRIRVSYEVEKYNHGILENGAGPVPLTFAERMLNRKETGNKTIIDSEAQYYLTLDAFRKNTFFVLVDDQQYSRLDEVVALRKNSVVSFIKLTPLVGG